MIEEFVRPTGKTFFGKTCGFAVRSFLAVLFLAIFSGCAKNKVEEAFKGGISPERANRVIGEYCQGCHVHKSFDPYLHIPRVRKLYNRAVFKETKECRVCHYIEKDWMYNRHKRRTRMPEDAAGESPESQAGNRADTAEATAAGE